MSLIDQAIAASLLAASRGLQGAPKVLIALSGGVDSMVLLDAAQRIGRATSATPGKMTGNFELRAMHVHHGLSSNADAWADFCQRQCDQRNITLTIVRVGINREHTDGLGVEGAARRARYAELQADGASLILLGQHADDQAETVLHQLLRGTGLAGLAAMGAARTLNDRQQLLRPLLAVSRAEIEAYAIAHQLEWIQDESNADTTYMRNFIRHELTPLIASRFPHYVVSLMRAARHAADSAQMLEALAKLDLQWDGHRATVGMLDKLGLVRQCNALYHWLRWHNASAPSHAQIEEWARQLFRASPTDKPHFAGGHDFVIRRKADTLIFEILPTPPRQ